MFSQMTIWTTVFKTIKYRIVRLLIVIFLIHTWNKIIWKESIIHQKGASK